jgi:hypothetical protein
VNVWLIGENNPYSRDPRFDLYCKPPESAGGRLCRVILGMTKRDYLRAFRRLNLLRQLKWSAPAAREAADGILCERGDADQLVLLGSKVFGAFAHALPQGWRWQPFTTAGGGRLLLLPHPSGRCRLWNEPGAVERARRAIGELAPHLQPLLGRAERAGQVAFEHVAGPYLDLLQRCVRCEEVITDSRSCTPALRGFEDGAPVVRVGSGWIASAYYTDPKVPCRSDA